jgi:hypothetical protein
MEFTWSLASSRCLFATAEDHYPHWTRVAADRDQRASAADHGRSRELIGIAVELDARRHDG